MNIARLDGVLGRAIASYIRFMATTEKSDTPSMLLPSVFRHPISLLLGDSASLMSLLRLHLKDFF